MGISFKDVRIVNKADLDGDGYARSFRLEFDVNSDSAGSYYVKANGDYTFVSEFLAQSANFAVNGTEADYRGVDINFGAPGMASFRGPANFWLDLYNAATGTLVQRWYKANDPDLGAVLVEPSGMDVAPVPPVGPVLKDARIVNKVDQDGDGHVRSFRIEFDIDSNIAGNYYVKLYLDYGVESFDKFLMQTATFAVNGSVQDYQGVDLNADAYPALPYHALASFRLALYDAATGTFVRNFRKTDDPDLGGKVSVENSSSDAPVFAPAFADVRIVNRVDQDADGLARSFRLEFDVNSYVAGNYYVKLYRDSGLEPFDQFLLQTTAFAVNGTGVDYQGVDISVDAYPDLASYGAANFRLGLYKADTDTFVRNWRKTDDADLGGVLLEKSSEDVVPAVTFAPAFKDARIVNRVDQDGDGFARSFRIEFDVDSNIAGSYYVKVFKDAGWPYLDDYLLVQSARFAVNGRLEDYQGVDIDVDAYAGLPSRGSFDIRLALYNAATETWVESWVAFRDPSLGGVRVEQSSQDVVVPIPTPAPTFAPSFTDARIVNRVDEDGDGYARSFRIEFNVDSNMAGRYYVKVFEADDFSMLDDFLVQSAIFSVNGSEEDYQGVDIDADLFPGRDLLSHGTSEFRLHLYDAAIEDPMWAWKQTWNPAQDASLGAVLVEQSIEDSGNVLLVSGAGNDTMQGGDGTDVAAYSDSRANYTFVKSATGFTVTDVTGKDGIDTLESFERIKFADGGLAFDVSPTQSAGQTALLLGAVLPGTLALHESKQALVGTVIGFFDEGYTLKELSGALMRIPIWSVLTGLSAPTNTDIASYLLTNVLHRAPDAAALAAAVNAINTESFQGEWLAGLAMSAESQAHIGLAGLATSGLAFL